MKFLGLDTSNKFLVISLMDKDQEVFFSKLEVYRNASELTNMEIDKAFKAVGWHPSDLDAVVVTRGPGSFTGIRIAMSIAKVLATTLNIPLYSLSSLNFYAGLKDTSVILDARSAKAYYGEFKDGKTISEEMLKLEEIKDKDPSNIIGEVSLLGGEDKFLSLEKHFLDLKDFWRLESALEAKPDYYKSNL